MNNENRRFLEEGIKRYEEALDTIIAFEQEIGRIVEQAARSRDNWQPLKEVKIKQGQVGRGTQDGYWIPVLVTGKTLRRENAVIDFGLWWRCRYTDCPIIYSNFYYEPKRVMAFTWNGDGKIRSFSAWKRTFLYLPLRNPQEIEGSSNRLLDALLKQLR